MERHLPVFIFIAPFLSAFIVPFLRKSRSATQLLTATALAFSSFCSLKALCVVSHSGPIEYALGGWAPPYGIEWRLDCLNALMCFLISTIALVVILATGPSVKKEIPRSYTTYYVLVLLHLTGLLGMALTHDLFNLFVFLEVASLTGYALIASGDSRRGNVASFKYLLIGTIGASFYLLGIGYLYAATGTLNMGDMGIRIHAVIQSRSVFLGVVFVLLGLLIKMGLFPFHGWLPDAYTYASNSATALIAPLMTKVSIYVFIRIFGGIFDRTVLSHFHILPVLLAFSAIAIIGGSVMAFLQSDLKRMLAYSSISHIGLIMLALSLNDPAAWMGAILHILNHAVMKAVLFLAVAGAAHTHGVTHLQDLRTIRGRMPFTLTAVCIASLSMIGIPPLAGFFSKWYILTGAFQSGKPLFVIIVLLSGLLTALYFFKMLEQIFFQKDSGERKLAEAPLALVAWPFTLSIGLLLLGFYAPAIYAWGMQHIVPVVFV
ncbi:MAG: monovalent cation/H+ antiporter subunit D family protein [Candidatus Omnitrophica bacterium]|nr:monovalent cation/H+ antiporter subunit D family protein [Candidatus Omnitrophota bacterium]